MKPDTVVQPGELASMAIEGAEIAVRVTPGASRNAVLRRDRALLVHVTAAPEGGKANAAVQKLLAKALGVAKSRVVLVRGQTARDKVFRVDQGLPTGRRR